MAQKKMVAFDFDGVLYNTKDLAYALSREANPDVSDEYFDNLSVGNFQENLARAMREDGYKVQADWEERYSKGMEELTTHDIIGNLVRDLSREYVLSVVSSSESRHLRKSLDKEELLPLFSDILGCDVDWSKSVKIKSLLEQYELAPSDIIFITDTTGDVIEAASVGVRSIGVTWGFHSRKLLSEAGALAVVDTVPELEVCIKQFFTGRVQ